MSGPRADGPTLRIVDSITDLSRPDPALVAVAGSHGGEYSGRWALGAGLSGAIFHDAGLGLDAAGIAGLALLERYRVAAAAVAASSARIGDGRDIHRRGVISQLNQSARRRGIRVGMPCRQAAELMLSPAAEAPGTADRAATAAGLVERVRAGTRCDVWVLDSVSEAGPLQDGAIVVTGSHGGLPGGQPRRALKCDALFAAFNAAGAPADLAGVPRLAALDQRGIAAVAVDAMSARIGSGRSTLSHGVVAVVNQRAAALGARPGDQLDTLVNALADGAGRPTEGDGP